jgi:diketogulonate reductase-like aldo/keto reductase
MEQDSRILQGALMEQHRRIVNEIADIKAANFELSDEDRKKITNLEQQLRSRSKTLRTL